LLSVNMTLDPVSGGGSAARTLQATRAIAHLGVQCAVAASADGIDARVTAALGDVTLTTLPTFPGRLRVPYGGVSALREAVRRADVVMLVNHWTAINVLAWREIAALGKPYVVSPVGALPLAGGRSPVLKRLYNLAYGRSIIGKADAHVAVTSDETKQFAAYGVDPSSVVVIPNGMPEVAPADGAPFRSAHSLGDAPVVLFLGRLAPIKGPDLLLSAFARCSERRPEWRLVFGGPDDGMLAQLRAQASALGMTERVRFAGFLDEVAKAQALAAADLIVVPSRREAMSIVVLEAAAAGRPTVITDQCGVPEVAENGGWVVEATEDALARALTEATLDRAGLVDRGRRWRDAARMRYSWPSVAKRYVDLFSRVIAEHGR
jgi:glycosyltransferase involved in cell wall biosynthesis